MPLWIRPHASSFFSSSYSALWQTMKTPAASAAPTSSSAAYAPQCQMMLAPPLAACEVAMPTDTAGFSEPPETAPMAHPPTVTHEPIARPKYSDNPAFVVATESTTKHSTKVKTISAAATCPQP